MQHAHSNRAGSRHQTIPDTDADLAEYDRQLARFCGLSSIPADFSPQPRPRNTAASATDTTAPTSAGAGVDRAGVHESVPPAIAGTMAPWQSGAAPADLEAPARVPKRATMNPVPLYPDIQQRTDNTCCRQAKQETAKEGGKEAQKALEGADIGTDHPCRSP